jgi:adenylate kinase family enzyme
LAEVLQIPFIELDAIFWGPNWSMPDDSELCTRLSAALAGEEWVLDGNYSRTLDLKWARVQTVVWLDYSFPRTVAQAIKRAFGRLISRKELWPGTGNRESLKMLFSRESIVLYTIQSYGRRKKKFIGYLNDPSYSYIKFFRLKSPQDARNFLATVKDDPGQLLII